MMRPTLWDIKWMEGESLVLVPFNSNTNLSLGNLSLLFIYSY